MIPEIIPKCMIHFIAIKITACTILITLGSNYTNHEPPVQLLMGVKLFCEAT